MTNKRLKLLIAIIIILIAFIFGYNQWYSEDFITEMQGLKVTEQELWEATKQKLADQVNLVINNYSISEAIVKECTEQVSDDYKQCIKSIVWVSNAESTLFTKGMNPSNNWLGLMYKWKKMKFWSIEESIYYWVSLYNKNSRGRRIHWEDWVWTYCMSECTYWTKNYYSAVNKLNLD